jgi:hypothetical protein
VHHGVGLKVSKRAQPERFAESVRRALADDGMHSRARVMAARLAPDVGAPKAIAVLQALAAPAEAAAPARSEARSSFSGSAQRVNPGG